MDAEVSHRWLDPTEEVRPENTLRIRANQLYLGQNVQGSQTCGSKVLQGAAGAR